MTKLGVIFGGKSGEHDISLMSAASVLRAIDTNKFEIVMIVYHHAINKSIY